MLTDEHWMRVALDCARQAEVEGEVPVGCVIVQNEMELARGYNQPIISHDPTAHAEVQALRKAAKTIGNYRLLDTTLYVTLEPCAMCVGAILHARVQRVVFGASDPKAGALSSLFHLADEVRLNHRLEYSGGVLAEESAQLLRSFFKQRR
jgi:tRNA(adenine34) deaminase